MSDVILRDTLTPALSRPDTRPLMAALAKTVEVEMRKHWRQVNGRRPNRQGLFRSNFWMRHGYDQTAALSSAETSAVVRVGDGAMRYQVEGGVIRPLAGKKGLTIPKTNEAKRAGSARNFPRALQWIPTPGYGGLIAMLIDIPIFGVRRRRDGSRATKREGTIQYYVVPQVSKGADSTILPAADAFDAPLRTSVERWLRSLWRAR